MEYRYMHLTTLIALFSNAQSNIQTEPKRSQYDYEERIFEKIIRLEHTVQLLEDKFDIFSKEILTLKDDLRNFNQKTKTDLIRQAELTEEMRWDEWGQWGACTSNCNNTAGERLQARTRNKTNGSQTRTQSESRLCNSVQFAGCMNPQNDDQFFAVAYDYSDMLAQSTCAALAPATHIRAVRRTCSDKAIVCSAVCANVGMTCFNSLHVYSDGNAPALVRDAVEQKSLMMYKYNACGGGCGPNFCCCKS